MKKLVLVVLALMLCASWTMADQQYANNGTNVGIATKLNATNGLTITRSGQTATISTTVFSASTDSVSLASGTAAIPVTAKVVQVDLNGDVNSQSKTLANGTAGQILTINAATLVGSHTMVITPATCTGFASIKFTAAKQSITLQYNTTLGWVIIGNAGATIQ